MFNSSNHASIINVYNYNTLIFVDWYVTCKDHTPTYNLYTTIVNVTILIHFCISVYFSQSCMTKFMYKMGEQPFIMGIILSTTCMVYRQYHGCNSHILPQIMVHTMIILYFIAIDIVYVIMFFI